MGKTDSSTKASTELAPATKRRIRRRVLQSLESQGFEVERGQLKSKDGSAKQTLRELHLAARVEKAQNELDVLAEYEPELLAHFADGSHIEPAAIKPEFIPIETDTPEARLYRYATLLWSVPVSKGFGRRKRFLVRDQANGKLIGLFAMGDPVFNLRCRDEFIGWTSDDREERLYNVMDVFVLGAVPPYNEILGGKLVAYIAACNEVRRYVEDCYRDSKTVIQGKRKRPDLALLTTSSALGKSALYSRIRFRKKMLYDRIGETQGWGHFHLNHGLFEELVGVLEEARPGRSARNRFGQGPNWKIRTAREALSLAGLPPELMKHGVGREVYAIRVSWNFEKFLRGETDRLRRRDLPLSKVVQFWKERWMEGRCERRPGFKNWSRREIPKLVRHGTDLEIPNFRNIDDW